MKQITFDDRYNLTDLVLSGQKTQTRILVDTKDEFLDGVFNWDSAGTMITFWKNEKEFIDIKSPYHYGDEIAIKNISGYGNNKPNIITITDIRFERLQDINDEDCIKEGVLKSDKYAMPYGIPEKSAPNGVFFYYSTPREAFANLIDKIHGMGTWESNPWVWVYEFELIK